MGEHRTHRGNMLPVDSAGRGRTEQMLLTTVEVQRPDANVRQQASSSAYTTQIEQTADRDGDVRQSVPRAPARQAGASSACKMIASCRHRAYDDRQSAHAHNG